MYVPVLLDLLTRYWYSTAVYMQGNRRHTTRRHSSQQGHVVADTWLDPGQHKEPTTCGWTPLEPPAVMKPAAAVALYLSLSITVTPFRTPHRMM